MPSSDDSKFFDYCQSRVVLATYLLASGEKYYGILTLIEETKAKIYESLENLELEINS